jgi:voltage-gated potassium channel
MTFVFNLLRLSLWFFRAPNLKYVRKDRMEHLLRAILRLRVAVGMIVFAVLVGTLGYRFIEHTPWFDAYYMSLVTISTVGFGEVIPLSFPGRVFTSFLIIFNIGFFAYAVSTLVSIFSETEVHAFFFDYYMKKQIHQLRQHTIVCGYGRHAIEVCRELTKQQTPFVIVEIDPGKINLLQKETAFLYLEGDVTEDAMLIEAGIEHAAALVVTLPLDASNLFVVMSARQINPGLKIISRLNNAADEKKLLRAGANHVVMPERIGGFYMATLVNKPDLVEFFTLISNMGANQVVFEEIAVEDFKKQFHGQSIEAGGVLKVTDIPIVGLRFPDGRYQLNPKADVVLQPDMHVIVLGDAAQIKRFSDAVLDEAGEHAQPFD